MLCRQELRVYNMEAGTFVTKLKGVMNQKMPYYIETGDCVTTFKAGENRFPNSLLVSGVGRVLVCGDETLPLLVWNLKSRKLMCDLRVAHHDFITSLSAITHGGNYVCCVCHEIDELSLNFIVVYDLQTGTLFKKWKPSCNTVSLAISLPGGCVISGLENARILVWDLNTGNCRWYLYGHTAPVSLLRLDPTEGFCLSTDKESRDRAIRIWDINRGNLVASYSPNANVSACEISCGGRFLLLLLGGTTNHVTLRLRGPGGAEPPLEREPFGEVKNDGKVYNMSEVDAPC